MKTNFTLILIFSVYVSGLWAQATPNSGFESWTHVTGLSTYDTPDNWDCANGATAITGTLTCYKATAAADIHSGTAAMRLITKQIGAPFNQLAPGAATTGKINTTTQVIDGGIPYTLRPDSIVGWYKYTSVQSQNGMVQFHLFGARGNSDTIATAVFKTPAATVGIYTRFTTPLVYRSTNAVTNSMWILVSSNNDGATGVGSTLYVDDIDLIFNTVGISEQNKPEFTISPNPAVDQLIVKNESNLKAQFVLYDVTGHKIAEEKLTSFSNKIDVNSFSNGFYIYSVVDENNKVINAGKISIQK